MQLNIEVEGANQLLASFLAVQKGIVDLRQLGTWDWVQSEYYKIVKAQFGSEGGAGLSGKWKPLTPKYRERKIKKYGDMPILQASGRFYKSMTSEGADGSITEKKPQELTLGSSVPYGPYHQKGGGSLPRREVISFTPDQEKRLVKPIETKLKQLIANAKLSDLRGF